MPDDLQKDPRVYMAAERTFLAWIRTGLALMGFGFVVARFGLLLRELKETQPELHLRSSGFSIGVGIALISIGVLVNIAAAFQHVSSIRILSRGEFQGKPSSLGIVISVILSIVGGAMAIYLMSVK